MKRKLNKTWRNAVRAYQFLKRMFPVTWTGAALLALAGVTIWTQGVHHKDLVLFTGALVMLAVQALLLLLTIAATLLAALRTRRARTPIALLHLETNSGCATGFAVRFPGWLPVVSLSWEWVTPAAREVL